MQNRISKILLFPLILLLLAAIALTITSAVLYSTARRGTGAITSNGLECAKMGRKIFGRGGNVADAAVTTILCEGISNPASCGIGGGLMLVIYLKDKGIVQSLNARERAPRNAKTDMFVTNPEDAVYGGKAVAVPGELLGLWELHQKYGTMKWKDLLQPIIDLCRNGHLVSRSLRNSLINFKDELLMEPTMTKIFVDPKTSQFYQVGDKIKRLKLAETLEVIANDGVGAIYNGGDIGKLLVDDIRKYGGIMVVEDLVDYKVEWSDPISTKLSNNLTLYTTPLPSSGAVSILMLNLLRNDQISPDLIGYQRMIEAMKFGYAHRTKIGGDKNSKVLDIMDKMIDLNYADQLRKFINDDKTSNDAKYYGAYTADVDDHGTAHISILAPNGDAISVTSTLNHIFGAMFISESTGIILNDQMGDFSIPGGPNVDGVLPSPNNFPIPGNNPLSSMTPIVVVDGNGDTYHWSSWWKIIISAVFQVLYRILFFKEPLGTAIRAPRLHHELTPMTLSYEPNFDQKIIRELNVKIGHEISSGIRTNVVVVSVENGEVKASYDPNRGGSVVVFDERY